MLTVLETVYVSKPRTVSLYILEVRLKREDRKHTQSDFDPTSSCTAEKGFRLAISNGCSPL